MTGGGIFPGISGIDFAVGEERRENVLFVALDGEVLEEVFRVSDSSPLFEIFRGFTRDQIDAVVEIARAVHVKGVTRERLAVFSLAIKAADARGDQCDGGAGEKALRALARAIAERAVP